MELIQPAYRDNNTDIFENASHFLNPDIPEDGITEKYIITQINNKFECAATHYESLQILSSVSSEISNESLIKQFPNWIGKMTQILTHASVDSIELPLVCKAIDNLFKICKQIGELDKRISMYHIKHIVAIVVEKYLSEENIHLINLLIVLLYRYPDSCAHFQTSFRKVILPCIDHKESNFVIAAAKCYALLVRALERSSVYSNKTNSPHLSDNNAANCHLHHQIDLCNNLCEIMDEIFQNIIDISPVTYNLETIKGSTLQLTEISRHDIAEFYATIENRFCNICTYLSTLLRAGGSNGKKFVSPDIILQVICRGMAIKPINLEKQENEHHNKMMLSVLPKLQFGLLKILQSLIASFQVELLPYAQTIQSTLLQTIQSTHQISHKSYKQVKLLVYTILSLWLKETRSLSCFQLVADEFLSHLYKDLLPSNSNLIFLTSKEKKHRNGKKREIENSGDNCPLVDSNIFNNIDTPLFLQVLSTIQTILLHSVNSLKSSFYIKIRDLIIFILFEQYIKKSKTTVLNAECRLQLVKTLQILQTNTHVAASSASSYAVQIFGTIISEEHDTSIIQEASLGLTALRHMLNPSAPTLMLQSTSNSETSENYLPEFALFNDKSLTLSQKRPRIEVNET